MITKYHLKELGFTVRVKPTTLFGIVMYKGNTTLRKEATLQLPNGYILYVVRAQLFIIPKGAIDDSWRQRYLSLTRMSIATIRRIIYDCASIDGALRWELAAHMQVDLCTNMWFGSITD